VRSGSSVLVINTIQTLVRLVSNLVLIQLLGYYGLAVSAGIGLCLQVILLWYFSRNIIGWRIHSRGWAFVLKVLAAGGIAYGVTLLTQQLLIALGLELSTGLVLAISGAMLLGIYCALLLIVCKILRKTEDAKNGKRKFEFL